MKSEHYELRQLLNLYYGGLTTPDDEKRLVRMLEEAENLPEELAADRDIVAALSEGVSVDVPDDALGNISLMIDKLDRQERRNAAGRRFVAFAGVAASLAIVVTLVLFIVKGSTHNPNEITDPQTAYNETERALLMVSESLNKTGEFMDEATRVLSKITFPDDSLYEDDFYGDSINNEIDNDRI